MSQPPPMKLWEAVSAFREFKPALEEVFGNDKWRQTYWQSFFNFDELVRKQDRRVLDSYLPVELTREIATRCTRLQFCLSQDGWLRRATDPLAEEAGAMVMSAVDVHDRFGGSVIEEVLEKGSTRVRP